MRGEITDRAPVDAALEVIWQYRAAHAYSLAKATMGLRSMVKTERCPMEVSQRMKRMTTILDKLQREPTMQLANMQDIGGCRAVFQTISQLRQVEQRLKRNRPPLRYSDYVVRPRASGYRGVHVIVGYDDADYRQRAIEVQLRTTVMHEWAITVERLSGRVRDDLKSGRGPDELLTWLAAISEAMAIEEVGEVVPTSLITRISDLRTHALPYLEVRPNG